MVKSLIKVGNSRALIIDKPILDLLKMDPEGSFDVSTKDGGLFLKPIDFMASYERVAKKHRKSLDKLGR